MMPSAFGAKVLLEVPEESRADIINRTVNLKDVSPRLPPSSRIASWR